MTDYQLYLLADELLDHLGKAYGVVRRSQAAEPSPNEQVCNIDRALFNVLALVDALRESVLPGDGAQAEHWEAEAREHLRGDRMKLDALVQGLSARLDNIHRKLDMLPAQAA